MDGIDAAIIETDGKSYVHAVSAKSCPYDVGFAEALRSLAGPESRRHPSFSAIQAELTDRHADLVLDLIGDCGWTPAEIDVIGFHGQTVFHDPGNGITDQVGDAARLSAACGVPVVADFRRNDVVRGGQGAPFAPLYHEALASSLERPLAVLNLGGVGNVTWLGPRQGDILAFDTGPANALMDDWVRQHTGAAFDADGELASAGVVEMSLVSAWMGDRYFELEPPKSLDRNAFDVSSIAELSAADGAATLMAFTISSIEAANRHFPDLPVRWLVTGGGRHNRAMMRALGEALAVTVEPVEAVGWDGDALEAQAFAYLAVRSLEGLPLSLPSTTGVPEPATGGRLFWPSPQD